MFEWSRVPTYPFVNDLGQKSDVKIMHEPAIENRTYESLINGRDLDLIAYEEMGLETEALRICELNHQKIVERDLDYLKLTLLDIPQT